MASRERPLTILSVALTSFNVDPSGQFMYVCNHRGDSVTTFRVHVGSGSLTFTGQYTAVGSPAVITFLTLT